VCGQSHTAFGPRQRGKTKGSRRECGAPKPVFTGADGGGRRDRVGMPAPATVAWGRHDNPQPRQELILQSLADQG
jgi:hypothetical protein